MEFEGSEIEFVAIDSINQFGDFFKNQFESSDGDKNGKLDAKEARGNFFLQRLFPVADVNGDGMMTLRELNAYVEHVTTPPRAGPCSRSPTGACPSTSGSTPTRTTASPSASSASPGSG